MRFTGYEQGLHGFIVIQHVFFFFFLPHPLCLPFCRYFHRIYCLKSSGVLFLLVVSKICAVDPLGIFPHFQYSVVILLPCILDTFSYLFFSVLINQFCKYWIITYIYRPPSTSQLQYSEEIQQDTFSIFHVDQSEKLRALGNVVKGEKEKEKSKRIQ